MFRKLILALVLLALLCNTALAEALYVPGEITENLLRQAFDEGKVISTTLRLNAVVPEDVQLSEEDAALLEVLGSSALTLGMGKIDGGLRFELGAAYESETPVTADFALNLTWDDVTVESSLIPGDRFTADWQTLLQLAGVDQQTIDILMQLPNLDMEAVMAELLAALEQISAAAAPVLAPYGEAVAAFIAELPTQVSENVPASYGRPPLATEIQITVTAQDLSRLIVTLADMLEADQTLVPLLDMALAEAADSDLPATTAELCADLREAAATITSDIPVTFVIGLNEAEELLYVGAIITDGTQTFLFNLMHTPGADENTYSAAFVLLSGETITDGLTVSLTHAGDPADPNVNRIDADLKAYAEGEVADSMTVKSTSAAKTTADGLKGYDGEVTVTLSTSVEGEKVSVIAAFVSDCAQRADGGETIRLDGSLDIYVGDENLTAPYQMELVTAVGESGPTIDYSELIRLSDFFINVSYDGSAMGSSFGMTDLGESLRVITKDYDPASTAALNAVMLATATEEELTNLVLKAAENVNALQSSLLEQLPQALFAAEEEAAVQPSAPSGLGASVKALQ